MTIKTLPQRYRPTTWAQEEMAMRAVSKNIVCPPYWVNPNHPLTQGLVSWYICLPGLDGGKYLYDIVEFNNLTLTNTPVWQGQQGKFGSLLFNGTNNYNVATTALIQSTPLTIACWLKPAAIVANNLVGLYAFSSSTTGFELRQQSSSVRASVVQSGSFGVSSTSTGSLAVGTWSHACAVFTSSTSRAAYLNGRNPSTPDTTNLTPSATLDRTTMACRASSSTYTSFFGGSLNDVMIWNRALSASEIMQVYEQPTREYRDMLLYLGKLL